MLIGLEYQKYRIRTALTVQMTCEPIVKFHIGKKCATTKYIWYFKIFFQDENEFQSLLIFEKRKECRSYCQWLRLETVFFERITVSAFILKKTVSCKYPSSCFFEEIFTFVVNIMRSSNTVLFYYKNVFCLGWSIFRCVPLQQMMNIWTSIFLPAYCSISC